MSRPQPEITIEGKSYRVVENLGYRQSAGLWAKVVVPAAMKDDDNRQTVVSRRRDQGWRFWTPADRIGG